MLKIETEGGVTGYAPGALLQGRCKWQLDSAPESAVIRLFWHTEGRGTPDIGIVEEQDCNARSLEGEYVFSFKLPEGPYSFSGSLIALHWALEFVIDDGKEVQRLDLVVSPWQTEVVLQPYEGEPR